MVVLHLNFNQVASFENQFKLVLKLSLKDQILIDFTQPNSYLTKSSSFKTKKSKLKNHAP
jgi:hypothetical protein